MEYDWTGEGVGLGKHLSEDAVINDNVSRVRQVAQVGPRDEKLTRAVFKVQIHERIHRRLGQHVPYGPPYMHFFVNLKCHLSKHFRHRRSGY